MAAPVLTLILLLQQVAVPAPVGYVNDFAHVLDTASVSSMETVITEVREKTRGEIAVVTLPDIGDRPASDVALQIGRAWKVGAEGAAGDPAKNAGIVILLVPRKNHVPGSGALFIATGRGAEGFLPDARVGRIRDAMTPDLAREEYGPGLLLGVQLVGQAFADEFGVTLTGAPAAAPDQSNQRASRFPVGLLLFLLLLFFLSRRRRRIGGVLPFWIGGGWGGGGWGGGGGGGGFGGFGGGGGFSGGGAGGRF